jgi:hypothetical protein
MADKYITRAELRLEPYDIKHELVDEKYLETLQDITYEAINKFIGETFEFEGTEEVPVEVLADGLGAERVFLKRRILTLTSVRVYVSTNTYYDYDADNFWAGKYNIEWKKFANETRLITGPSIFEKGIKNIGIFGIWGYESCPKDIKFAQGLMIKALIEDKSFAANFSNFSSGDFSYTLRKQNSDALGRDDSITGNAQIDLILKHNRRPIFYGTSGT